MQKQERGEHFLSFEELSTMQHNLMMKGSDRQAAVSSLSQTLTRREWPSGFGANIPFLEEEVEVGSNPRLPLGPYTEQNCGEQIPGRSQSPAGGSTRGPKRVKFLFSSRPFLKLFLVKSKCFQVTPGRKMPGITMWVYSAGRGACNVV